ncbi:MAG: aldo/keto reductase [Anaerolineae bacterium]|nr:aldo/keto reductase [Anaerolineae bacterium]
MEYRNLGRSGLKVSEICLGTMTFGGRTTEAESIKLVDMALAHGVNFFDTADGYGSGASESILGKALKGSRRRQAVVATKFFNPMGPGPNDSGMSRVHIMHAIEDSLRRLAMDYVDIYYIHHVDIQTPIEEMLRALDDLVHQGKVRYIACSNYQAWRLMDALWISDANGLARFVCYQPQYSLVVRDIEQELVPLCLDKGVGIVPWAPLGSGFLTGKFQPGDRMVKGSRQADDWAWHGRFFAPNADETLQVLLDAALALNKTPAQVALRWILEQPAISSVIAGVRTTEQLQDNLGAAGWRLEGEWLEKLTAVSHLPVRYPESFEYNTYLRRINAVKIPAVE